MEQMCDRQVAKTGAISVRSFRTIKVIGKGSYGKVLLVEKKDSGKMYALKILKKGEILRRNQLEHTLDERRILVSAQPTWARLLTLRGGIITFLLLKG
jgi:serine/threonine protein kinase